MLLGSLAFALMSTLAHELREAYDWQVVALVRAGLVLVIAALLALAGRARLVLWRPGTLWLRSIAGSISLVCTFFALTRLPVSEVLTLTNMFPLWVALLSWPMLQEPPSAGVWLAILCGLTGVVLIQRPHFAEGNFATAAALVASVSTAFAMIGLHRLRNLDVRAIVVHFSAVAVLFCLGSWFLGQPSAGMPNPLAGRPLFMLLGVGVAATVGQLFLTKAFAAGPPAQVSVVALTQVVFAMALEILFLHRSFERTTLIGMALVMAPTAWIIRTRI
ncbi:MAG: DMT family transporter [Planctomycetota bacterium]|nr:MAG: DMT family transporter [Planctomycetota bacterium]